jgi:hypothetical protein
MKKIISCALIIMICLFIVTGCKSAMAKVSGTYTLEYSKYVGDPDSAKSTETWTLELKEDGSGSSNRNGLVYNVKWELNEKDITVFEQNFTYKGTVEDNRLDLFNGDKTMSITKEYVFKK